MGKSWAVWLGRNYGSFLYCGGDFFEDTELGSPHRSLKKRPNSTSTPFKTCFETEETFFSIYGTVRFMAIQLTAMMELLDQFQ